MSEVAQEPSCNCPTVQVRRRFVAGECVACVQCLTCGRNLRTVPASRTELEKLPLWDEALRDAWRRRIVSYNDAIRDQRNREWRQKYEDHLQSEQWRELRRKVLKRAGGICEGCGERAAVQIHHRDYSRLGREMLFDLAAVCEQCHDAVHGRDRRNDLPRYLDGE